MIYMYQFLYSELQIHSEIDELHQHLQARRGSYGNSLPAAKMNSQAFKQFEMTVEVRFILEWFDIDNDFAFGGIIFWISASSPLRRRAVKRGIIML